MGNKLYSYEKEIISVSGESGGVLSDFESYGMPVLYLWGDLSAINKDVAGTFTYKYGDNTGTSTLKWQGNISAHFPKKNFTWNKISTPFEAKEGWGVQKKYCLKANYIDPSQARNIICARLWGRVVASRHTVPTELVNCPNYGAIDGFPIILVINDEFHGLYTLNIPKDAWTYNLTDGWLIQAEEKADVSSNDTSKLLMDGTDFTIDENPSEDDEETIKTAFKAMLDAVIACDGTDWSTVEEYLDIPSAIDYMCFSMMITDHDGIVKNHHYVSYDKQKFYISDYDMDAVLGNSYDGKTMLSEQYRPTLNMQGNHPIFAKLYQYRKEEVITRLKRLIGSVITPSTLSTTFSQYLNAIPLAVRNADSAKWGTMPATTVDGFMQITDYYRRRIEWIKETENIQ